MKFKVGNKVIIVSNDEFNNKFGVIMNIKTHQLPYRILLMNYEDSDLYAFAEDELQVLLGKKPEYLK